MYFVKSFLLFTFLLVSNTAFGHHRFGPFAQDDNDAQVSSDSQQTKNATVNNCSSQSNVQQSNLQKHLPAMGQKLRGYHDKEKTRQRNKYATLRQGAVNLATVNNLVQQNLVVPVAADITIEEPQIHYNHVGYENFVGERLIIQEPVANEINKNNEGKSSQSIKNTNSHNKSIIATSAALSGIGLFALYKKSTRFKELVDNSVVSIKNNFYYYVASPIKNLYNNACKSKLKYTVGGAAALLAGYFGFKKLAK